MKTADQYMIAIRKGIIEVYQYSRGKFLPQPSGQTRTTERLDEFWTWWRQAIASDLDCDDEVDLVDLCILSSEAELVFEVPVKVTDQTRWTQQLVDKFVAEYWQQKPILIYPPVLAYRVAEPQAQKKAPPNSALKAFFLEEAKKLKQK